MSQFYASIHGGRGEVTRQGTKKSGISGHIRGWNVGVQVWCYTDTEGKDHCQISATAGSNGGASSIPLAMLIEQGYGQPPLIVREA